MSDSASRFKQVLAALIGDNGERYLNDPDYHARIHRTARAALAAVALEDMPCYEPDCRLSFAHDGPHRARQRTPKVTHSMAGQWNEVNEEWG